jgi:hypothetical protein
MTKGLSLRRAARAERREYLIAFAPDVSRLARRRLDQNDVQHGSASGVGMPC